MMNKPLRGPLAASAAMTTAYELNLRHLRGILAVEAHGSISSAAQAVNLSQPALTQGILKLENQLGEVLFERRSDGMVPTASGLMVLERARACMRYLTAGSRLAAGADFEPDRRLTMTQLRAFLALLKAGASRRPARNSSSRKPPCTEECANSRKLWAASWWSGVGAGCM